MWETSDSFIEVDFCRHYKSGQRIGGDVFLLSRQKEGGRLVLFSDGVSQSGMGSRLYPLGWRRTIVRRMQRVLEELYLKKTEMKFL